MKGQLKELIFPLILNGINLLIIGFYYLANVVLISFWPIVLDGLFVAAAFSILMKKDRRFVDFVNLILCLIALITCAAFYVFYVTGRLS
ncbi:MAG: hypothetical protein IJ060_11660 [Oscillospiraceae bacterium]|nr:hypothetical protein [Oscillospiraceae bacterium]